MVDYSKWDRMDFSDSDSGDEADDDQQPRVTSLDTPGRVTIGADGSLDIKLSTLPTSSSVDSRVAAVASSDGSDNGGGSRTLPSMMIEGEQSKKARKMHQWQTQLSHNGGQHNITVTFEQESIQLPVYWFQDRYAVTLRVGFHPSLFPSKSIRVRVLGAIEYKDRYSAVGSGSSTGEFENDEEGTASFGTVDILSVTPDKKETVLLSGKLPRPIHLNQDEDEIGFEIEDNLAMMDNISKATTETTSDSCTKFVTVVLPKAVPMYGMVIWWDRPLIGFPTIDLSSIQDRSNQTEKIMSIDEYNASMDNNITNASTASVQQAWEEAHEQFRQKGKEREVNRG
ncbi:predicted protein [Thalassiosira pseudonana CCMP1335]|uniref:CS domain-containing protein n=1 Tax=Thalassiosira pseudonana TaxID=35128 RepID=B8C6P5_THAPS|nr:predicted protein [Thalassiosira pseudonana CCMP1335]EED90606.1 predicted protein [Thalassiosira pseudonana CCMP1335]